MSMQMNFNPSSEDLGIVLKNPRKLSSVRPLATYNSRRRFSSIW